MAAGDKYILKDGTEIEAIEVGLARTLKIGEKNNRLTVCDRAPNTKSKKARVICLCDCGKYTVINHQDFKEGKVSSCGCYLKETASQTGKKAIKDYSLLENNTNPFYEYISPIKEKWNWSHSVVWNIKCRKCGKIYQGIPIELINLGKRGMNPCDCWRQESIGVKTIKELLKQNNISFEQEKIFEKCLSPKGNPYKFDFYLPNYNILIEYDGEQHFKPRFEPNKEKAQQKLILQKEYDINKDNWCKSNNIILIRIPYFCIETLKIEDLLLKSKYIIGGEKIDK